MLFSISCITFKALCLTHIYLYQSFGFSVTISLFNLGQFHWQMYRGVLMANENEMTRGQKISKCGLMGDIIWIKLCWWCDGVGGGGKQPMVLFKMFLVTIAGEHWTGFHNSANSIWGFVKLKGFKRSNYENGCQLDWKSRKLVQILQNC